MVNYLSWGIAATAEEVDPSAGGGNSPRNDTLPGSYLALAGAEFHEEIYLEKGVFRPEDLEEELDQFFHRNLILRL